MTKFFRSLAITTALALSAGLAVGATTTTFTIFTSRTNGQAAEKKITIDQGLAISKTFGTGGVTAVTAAGSALSSAAALSANGFENVSGADGTKGVLLPTTTNGAAVPLPLWNSNASNALPVYPNTSTGTINGGSAGAAKSVPANTTCWFVPIDNTDDWVTIPKTCS